MYYKICNIYLYIKNENTSNKWTLFKKTSLKNKYVHIEMYKNVFLISKLEFIDLQDTNKHLVINGNDFMVVNEDWSKANIIKMNQSESFVLLQCSCFTLPCLCKNI